jgi:hypothetical protein
MVAADGCFREKFRRTVGRGAHRILAEIAEGVAQRDFPAERTIKRETLIGRANSDRCELGCRGQVDFALIVDLGALVDPWPFGLA